MVSQDGQLACILQPQVPALGRAAPRSAVGQLEALGLFRLPAARAWGQGPMRHHGAASRVPARALCQPARPCRGP